MVTASPKTEASPRSIAVSTVCPDKRPKTPRPRYAEWTTAAPDSAEETRGSGINALCAITRPSWRAIVDSNPPDSSIAIKYRGR
jgi:hypothetical protein